MGKHCSRVIVEGNLCWTILQTCAHLRKPIGATRTFAAAWDLYKHMVICLIIFRPRAGGTKLGQHHLLTCTEWLDAEDYWALILNPFFLLEEIEHVVPETYSALVCAPCRPMPVCGAAAVSCFLYNGVHCALAARWATTDIPLDMAYPRVIQGAEREPTTPTRTTTSFVKGATSCAPIEGEARGSVSVQ